MLSEELQRNAKHKARLSNIFGYFRLGDGSKTIRDGKPGLAPNAFGAALQLRFAQNDIMRRLIEDRVLKRISTTIHNYENNKAYPS